MPGSLVSELDCCSCVSLDKLVLLLGFSLKNIQYLVVRMHELNIAFLIVSAYVRNTEMDKIVV